MDRAAFRALARDRLKDAETLASAKRPSGAYYLAGYAIECALKPCIAKQTRRHDFPDKDRTRDSYSHDLSKLVKLAGLEQALKTEISVDPIFAQYWLVAKDWSEESRYRKTNAKTAKAILLAVGDPTSGVFQWLKQHW